MSQRVIGHGSRRRRRRRRRRREVILASDWTSLVRMVTGAEYDGRCDFQSV